MCGSSMVVLLEQWMMVKNDDDHRKACIVTASEGSRQDQNKTESRDFGVEKVGGMRKCSEIDVLVMVLTEMRSSIEYYV